MQVTTEQIDPCKIALTITVEPEKVVEAREKAFAHFARQIALPGFRKGKVPMAMARPYVDEARVRQRTAETLWQPAFDEAVAETKVEPFAQPQLEFVELSDDGPFVFKAFVPLKPVVTIGPYKGLELERRRLEVTDKDVDRQIDEVRTRYAEFPEITDRAVETGDVIMADLTATVEGEDAGDLAEARATVIEVGRNIADFDSGLVGMKVGETKAIEATYPEDFQDERLRGKKATFTVTVKEHRARVLPELNDEFVQRISQTSKTVDEFRAEVRESLDKAADQMADNDLEFRLVGEIVGKSQIHFPEVLLQAEMEADARQIEERIERDKITLEQYLASVGRTQEQLQGDIAASASQRIRNSLVLWQVAQAEGVTVSDEDVDAKIAERAERAKVSPAAVRAFAEKNNQMGQLRDQALTEKILAFLKEQATITDRTVTEEEMEALAAQENAAAESNVAGEPQPASAEPAEPLAVEKAASKRRSKKASAAETETPAAEEDAE
ncbi:MAG TPA: trigger factor [Armatimonadaceae bacterium]|nr:trigger factor [Armatimonadaceae bacterium]